jgi:molybdopterin molybdotransferase
MAEVKPFFSVVSPDEARKILLAVAPVESEEIPAVRSRGRVLAENLYSAVDLPHFHRAAMDGYAVKAKETFGASPSLPAYLKIAGTVEMGHEVTRPLQTGEAMRISTGGMLPPESDAVVMIEYTEEVGDGIVEIHRAASPWQNVIQIGDDIKKGEPVFPKGRKVRPQDVGALTGVGISRVQVYRRPRVALISTGDELVEAEAAPRPGQVRNINQHSLAALIEELGAELKDFGVIRDDRKALSETLTAALAERDLVLLSGGSSVGARDMALETILSFPRTEILFHGISVSPGKPTIFAKIGNKPVLGLPGYPVSALVIFDLFAAPLIRKIGGEQWNEQRFRKTIGAILKRGLASQTGREDYIRVTLERVGDRWYATPLPTKSGAIFTLVKADGMIKVDLQQEGVEEGAEVDVILF